MAGISEFPKEIPDALVRIALKALDTNALKDASYAESVTIAKQAVFSQQVHDSRQEEMIEPIAELIAHFAFSIMLFCKFQDELIVSNNRLAGWTKSFYFFYSKKGLKKAYLTIATSALTLVTTLYPPDAPERQKEEAINLCLRAIDFIRSYQRSLVNITALHLALSVVSVPARD